MSELTKLTALFENTDKEGRKYLSGNDGKGHVFFIFFVPKDKRQSNNPVANLHWKKDEPKNDPAGKDIDVPF